MHQISRGVVRNVTLEQTNKVSLLINYWQIILDAPIESSVPEMRSHTEKNCLACTTCGYNSTSSADLKRHMARHKATEGYGMNNTSGQSIYNTHPDIGNSLVECPTLEEPTQTNEKRFACPSCTYKCSSIPNMKSHMASHKVTEVYICDDADDCSFECDNMESLQKHKKSHIKKPTYANMAQNGTQSPESWIGPFKIGRPPKGQGQAVPATDYSYQNNHNKDNFTNNLTGNSFNKPTNYTKRGTNVSSSLSVGQHPLWAKVFASRYKREIDSAKI